MWAFLERLDVVLGIFGGIVTLWELIVAFNKRISRNVIPQHTGKGSSISRQEKGAEIIIGAIEKGSQPIAITMILTIALCLLSILFIESQEDFDIFVLPITITSFASIFVGLVIGAVVDILAGTRGKPVTMAISLAVIFAFLTAFMEAFNRSITLPALLGGSFGAILGLALDKSEQSKIPLPDGTWETAKKIATRNFLTDRKGKLPWISERIRVDSFQVEKGKATLTITIFQKDFFVILEESDWPKERCKLIIDRAGDILTMSNIPVVDEEKYKGLYNFINKYSLDGISRREQKITVEIKEPVTRVTENGLKVQIEFVVTNPGNARRVYPYVEYYIGQLKDGKYNTVTRRSPKKWSIDLYPNSIQPVLFEAVEDITNVFNNDPAHKPKVRLFMKPFE